jgi:hypothetical protein
MPFDIRLARAATVLGAAVLVSACAGTGPARSEHPVDEAQVGMLAPGIDRDQLVQRLGPPAEEASYSRLSESVMSWRLVEPGNRHMLFNAHFDPSGRVKHYSRTLDPATLGGDNSSF